jgi:hypothetical protein
VPPRANRPPRSRRPRQKALAGVLCLLTLLASLPPAALARPRRPGEGGELAHDKVSELTQQGTAALAAHDFATAERDFTAAYRMAASPQQLYPLGQLALLQGRIVAAQDLFRRYLHDSLEPPDTAARQEAQRVLQLPAPPSGEIRIVGDRNTIVFVDDHLIGALPLGLPLLMEAGEHRVVLEHDALHLDDTVAVMAGRLAEVRCQFKLGVLAMTLVPAVLLATELPDLGAEPKRQLAQALDQVASAVRMSILTRRSALLLSPKLADCLDTLPCRVELAAQNAVQYILAVNAAPRAAGSPDWQLGATVIDATVQDVAAEEQGECKACTPDKVADGIARSAEKALSQALARRRGAIELTSTPSGVEVRAGERSLGVTPLRRPQWVGTLELTLSHPGYRTQHATLEVKEGKPAALQVDLSPLPVVSPPPETQTQTQAQKKAPAPVQMITRTIVLPRPRWRLAVGGTALGLGVGLVGLGISALSVNGQCVPDSYVGTNCQNLYTTDGIGAGLLVGGALLIGGGVTLLALPGARRQIQVPVGTVTKP